jgi:poly(hydroxyalkanoate) depolymerase family esterase
MFNWGILFAFLALATSTSFALPALTPERFTLENKSGIREFYLYSPSAKPSGLVVMLHGCKTSALEFDQGTEMSKYGAIHNLAVLYPEQNIFYNYDRCWNWFWGSENEIIAEGIRTVQMRYGLKRDNTFMMGMSAGAAQASIMANEHRDLFKAALLHSGLQYLAATNLNDAQASLEHGAFTPYETAARVGFQRNRSLQPVQFMVVYGDMDRRVNPKNSQETAHQLLALNQLLAKYDQRPGTIDIKKSVYSPTKPMLDAYEVSIYQDRTILGSVIQINGLAHEWSGGNPVQPRNNPYGPKVVEKFFSLFK